MAVYESRRISNRKIRKSKARETESCKRCILRGSVVVWVKIEMNVLKRMKKFQKDWKEIKQERYMFMNQTENRRRSMEYAKAYKTKKVDASMFLYESYWGRGMIDNPYALFLEVQKRDKAKKITHVWVLDDLEENQQIIDQYKDQKNIQFVQFGSDEYIQALASAKYLINNVTFPAYFIKKEEQIYINTWHGTPLKSMGFDMVDGNSGSANTVRNFLHADYLLSANEIMTNMYLKSYKLDEVFKGKILEEGYPRNDFLFQTDKKKEINLLKEYGISIEENKKIILFAPTWRESENGKAEVNPEELLGVKKLLEDKIDTNTYQILIKPHQFVYNQLKDLEEYKGLLIPSTIDANELMSIVDILISDYSSIFLDYMALEKPILFYIPDLETYKERRGLDIRPEDLPGPSSDNLLDIATAINDIENVQKRYKNVYQEMKERVCGHDDGHVCERIIDIVVDGKQSKNVFRAKNTKKKLLISCGGLLENGISHSFLSLLEQIDYDEWDVTALVGDNPSDYGMHYKVNHMNPNVRALVMCGFRVATLEEEQKRMLAVKKGLYKSVWKKACPWDMFEREAKRIFGNIDFDYAVDFQGYNVILSSILVKSSAKKKAIWLHNDMKADMNKKVNGVKKNWECLYYNISLYPYFDSIVSCSNEVMKVNRKKLATKDTYDKFKAAKNTVNEKRILEYLENESVIDIADKKYLIKNELKENYDEKVMELVKLPEKGMINIVTMGRMSVEKNHMALISAFAKLHENNKNVRLYLLGAGPLENKIRKHIENLNATSYVYLTGNISNPFAIMKRCDCFILPSIHEGQPMVLLEARACGLPIIVSDFSTVKDSLYPDGQLLIGNDEESIYEGLQKFVDGKVPKCDFKLSDYNKEAYKEFIKAIQ